MFCGSQSRVVLRMAVLSLVLIYLFSSRVGEARTQTQEPSDDQVAQLSKHVSDFSMRLYNLLDKQDRRNVGLSPLSLYLAMGNLMAGASGKTRKEMEMVLGYRDTCQGTPCEDRPEAVLSRLYRQLNKSAANEDQVTLNVGNALFLDMQYKIKESYWTLIRDYFQTDLKPFSNTVPKEVVAAMINDYIDKGTNGMIKEAIQEGDLEATLICVIVNVLYFNGLWKVPFDKNKTQDRPFRFPNDQVVNISTMFVEGQFKTSRNETAGLTFIELEYGGGSEFSMLLAVPDQPDGLSAVEDRIIDLINVQMFKEKIKLFLPRFSVDYRAQLQDVLKSIGLQLTFNKQGKFKNMLRSDTDLTVDKVSPFCPAHRTCAYGNANVIVMHMRHIYLPLDVACITAMSQ